MQAILRHSINADTASRDCIDSFLPIILAGSLRVMGHFCHRDVRMILIESKVVSSIGWLYKTKFPTDCRKNPFSESIM